MNCLLAKITRRLLLMAVLILAAALACGPAAQERTNSSQPAQQSGDTKPFQDAGGIPQSTPPPAQTDQDTPIQERNPSQLVSSSSGSADDGPAQAALPDPVPTKPGPTPVPTGDACDPTGGNMYTGNFHHKGPEDVDVHMMCYDLMFQAYYGWPYNENLPDLLGLWAELQQAAAGDPEVAKAHEKVLACLAERGYDSVDPELLFFWQDFLIPEDYRARLTGYTAEERAMLRELARPADECAGPSGYYRAQSEAWRAEVNRIAHEELDKELQKARLLAASSIDFVVWKTGIPHFLTLDGALPITRIGRAPNATPWPDPSAPASAAARSPVQPTDTPEPSHPQGLADCHSYNDFASGPLVVQHL